MYNKLRLTRVEAVDRPDECERLEFAGLRDLFESLPHIGVEDKKAAALYTSALIKAGGSRCEEDVEGVGRLLVLDLDGVEGQQLERAWGALAERGWTRALLSSHNCKPDDIRVRLWIELDRELRPSEYPALWRAVDTLLGEVSDRACANVSHSYYTPTHPPGVAPVRVFEAGQPLQVDQLLRGPGVGAPQPASLDDVRAIAHSMRSAKKSEYLADLGRRVFDLLDGRAAAPEGERDQTLFQIAAALSERAAGFSYESIAAHLARGLSATSGGGQVFTPHDFADKMARAAGGLEAGIKARKRSRREIRISRASGGKRTTELSADEIAVVLSKQGASAERDMALMWFCGGSIFFVRPDGEIDPKPCSERNLVVVATERLAAFPWFEDETETATGGFRPKTSIELLKDYARECREVGYDFAAECSSFDARTHTLTIAATPLRVEPRRSELAEEFLHVLDPDGQVSRWLASGPLQDRATSALVMIGERWTGKSTIARGAAKVRAPGAPAPFKVLSANFNRELITSGGWIEADESLGQDYKKQGSTFLRHELATSPRYINQKHLDPYFVRGYLRVVVCANGKDVLHTEEELTRDASDAFGDRTMIVEVRPEAAVFLRSLVERDPEAFNALRNNEIAEHSLWLSQHTQFDAGRFLVKGNDSSAHDEMRSSQGRNGEVLSWLAGYVRTPTKVDQSRKMLVRTLDGKLWATAAGIADDWAHYLNTPPLTKNSVGRALQAISDEQRQIKRTPTDRYHTLYKGIDMKVLAPVAYAVEGMAPEQVQEVLSVDTEDRLGASIGPRLVPAPPPPPAPTGTDGPAPF